MNNTLTPPLPTQETLCVEFKSDRKALSDHELVEALVGLANSQGGDLLLGLEDDGTVTGLHSSHQNLSGLAAMVAARTSPSLNVTVVAVRIGEVEVAKITVAQSNALVATALGLYLRRRLKYDGTPECVPMLPHELRSREVYLGLVDASAQAVAGATLHDFDPIERERLRQTIRRYGGDGVLLELNDDELDDALGFRTRGHNGERVPTLTGLLMIGREPSLRELVPTHELAFQVLAREAVSLNEFKRLPLLKALEWLETNFRPYNPEKEVQIGLFRVPVPKVDMGAFREAVANALVHRDYHRLGATHIRLDDNGLTISNQGGLVDGVTLYNLLTTEPRPRNPSLADAMKRIGIVERSGRGVDKIYRGLLRFGRAEPNYARSDHNSVVLQLATDDADEAFLHMVVAQENNQSGEPLPIDSLIALATLRTQKRLDIDGLALLIHKDAVAARGTLERLIEAGLVQAHGNTRNRSYTLSATVYQAQGEQVAYTRQAGFTATQNEQMVISHIGHHSSHHRIQRGEVMELCRLTAKQANLLLSRLVAQGRLYKHGERRWTYYTLADERSDEHL